jgi:Acetyltransferase (GNAT) domain
VTAPPVFTSDERLRLAAEIAFGEKALQHFEAGAFLDHAYWRMFLEETPGALAPNLAAQSGIVRIHDRVWPISVHEPGGELSYPCSLATQYVRYPLEELALLKSRWKQAGAWCALHALGGILKTCAVDRTVQWSSGLLSTNLHAPELLEDAPAVTAALVAAFPRHAVLLKNIHGYEDSSLPGRLESLGYNLITSRQIYFFDGKKADFLSRSDVKRDLKALTNLPGYSVVSHEDFKLDDVPRIVDLYKQLYLDKHSHLNPQYTAVFVARALKERLLEFKGLRHDSGRLDAVYACYRKGGTTSTPFIGYDTALPSSIGFYRVLVGMLLRDVAEAKLLLNYSSGAGEFKRRRGGEPAIEWNAVYTRHLPVVRRSGYQLLGTLLNRIGRDFLENNHI